MAAAKKKKDEAEVLHVGVDLGTSRSAVAASNGVKSWELSLVGWPKDMIARKFLKKEIVFGDECLKNRLALEVYRPLEHGVIKTGTERDEEAARELVRHIISLADPDEDQSVRVVIGAPAEASTYNKQLIREAVSEIVDSCLIVSEPFTVAYGLDMLFNALVIDVGAGTIDLCIMHGTVPTEDDQKTVLQAGDYIDEQLFEMLSERFPSAQFTQTMVRSWKEEHAFVRTPGGGGSRKVEVTIPVGGKPTPHDITSEMYKACESILPHLKEELAALIATFDPEFQEEIRQNVIIAGGGSQIRGIKDVIEETLEELGGGKVAVVKDPLYAGASGALAIAEETTDEDWEQLKEL